MTDENQKPLHNVFILEYQQGFLLKRKENGENTLNKTALIVTVAVIVTALVVGGVVWYVMRPTPPAPPTPAREILVFATSDVPLTWDPSISFDMELTYLANMYEPLLWASPPGSPEPFTPALATSWNVSEDGLVWTFNLREGVKFHDGEPFNAEAVRYSINRTVETGLGAAYIWGPVESIEVIDDYTVKFTLTWPVPLDMIVSSSYGAWIMSPESAEKGTEWFEAGHDAGTGPYMLKSYSPGEEVVLTKFEDYWGGWERPEGYFSDIVCKIVHEALVQRQMLEAGEAQLAGSIPVDAVIEVDAALGTKVEIAPSFVNKHIHLNTERAPLNNKLVRQAIAYAIPYKDIITIGFNGFATQAYGPVPTGMFGHNETLFQYSYNLTKAQELLAAAGYPDGIDRTLTLTYSAEILENARFVPLIKESLAEIGIDVTLDPKPFGVLWERAKGDPAERQDMLMMLWWPTYPDPYDYLFSMWHSEDEPFFNLAYYKNPTFDNLIDDANAITATDPEEASAKYFEAQQILLEETPSLFLTDILEIEAMSEQLHGFAVNPAYRSVDFFYDLYWVES